MFHHSDRGNALSADVLRLILDNLVGDTETLARAGLVCRSWRALSLPSLLKHVDLSSHNNGRLHEYEEPSPLPLVYAVIMSDYSDEYRPRNLVPRQRAFLRLMTNRPELAAHVKVFTWTLVWKDFDEDGLTDIDLRTWDVFSRMQNVARLDLASLHNIFDQPFIRQNPARLFPAVTHLRLVGWMHRGLVKAILASLDARQLRCLELDHLQDEGALPNGEPMPADLAERYVDRRAKPYETEAISDELWARQERGEATIFPGHMWFPLRFLRQSCLSSMAHLQIRLGCFCRMTDKRSDITMFRETAEFIRSAKDTLETVSIGLGEDPYVACNDDALHLFVTGNAGMSIRNSARPFHFDLTSIFLRRLLAALTEERFPHLTRVDLEGFRVIRNDKLRRDKASSSDLTWQCIRACPFVDEEFTKRVNVDYRQPFLGYDYALSGNELDELEEIMGSI